MNNSEVHKKTKSRDNEALEITLQMSLMYIIVSKPFTFFESAEHVLWLNWVPPLPHPTYVEAWSPNNSEYDLI